MDSLYRNYFVVAVAGVFCWLNASVASAQTATDVTCAGCIGFFEFAPGVRTRFFQQEADIAQNSDNFAAGLGALSYFPVTVSSDTSTSIATAFCPANTIALSASCACGTASGTRNFGSVFHNQEAGNAAVCGCYDVAAFFDPDLPTSEATATVVCVAAFNNNGDQLVPGMPAPTLLSGPGQPDSVLGGFGNQKGLLSGRSVSGEWDAELDAALIAVQNQVLDYSTALRESKR